MPRKPAFFASIPLPALLAWVAIAGLHAYEALRTPTLINDRFLVRCGWKRGRANPGFTG